MSAFTAVACRLLSYRGAVARVGIARKTRCIIPGNSFSRAISTSCKRFSVDDKSGVDPTQSVTKTEEVKTQIYTHDNADQHQAICKALFRTGSKNLFKWMSENKTMFKVVQRKDGVEVIASNEEILKKAKMLVEKELDSIKNELKIKPSQVYEEMVPLDNPAAEVTGRFIGEKGVNIRSLEEKVKHQFKGCKSCCIKPRGPREFHVVVNLREDGVMITGDDEELVKAAKIKVTEELQKIASRYKKGQEHAAKTKTFTADVNVKTEDCKRIVSLLVGKKGRNIRLLENEVGFRFSISAKPDLIEVIVYDDENNLEKAVQLVEREIQRIISNETYKRDPTEDNASPEISRTIEVGEEINTFFGRLIGKQGQNVKRLRKQGGVQFNIEKIDHSLIISAKNPADLDAAVEVVTKEIETLKEELKKMDPVEDIASPVISKTIEVGEDIDVIFRRLIGKQGQNVNRLRQQAGFPFSVDKTEDSSVLVSVKNPAELASAVEVITKEVETLKKDTKMGKIKTTVDSNLSRAIHFEERVDLIFSRLIGKGGENVKLLRKKIGMDFSVDKKSATTLNITVNDPANLDKVVAEVRKAAEALMQEMGSVMYPEMSVEWDKVFNGEMEPLGIFEKSDLLKESPRIECPLWDKLEAEEMSERRRAYDVNNFQRMISLTKEGKLWKFPINNDQDWTEEEDVSFGEHVFLDHLIADFPKKGPVRHFMELVIAGLSKNPHMTVKEKHEHIEWYRTYFNENKKLMIEELGEELGTIKEQHQHA